MTILNPIAEGDQVYNYYGSKSNSELLVGYGFTLLKDPSGLFDNDVVNLKSIGTDEGLSLYRAMHCYTPPPTPLEEVMFQIRAPREPSAGHEGFAWFSHGLVDLLICEIANKRERRFLRREPSYCPQSDPYVFEGPLYRAATAALEIRVKLHRDIKSIESVSDIVLG